jgi:hypothetical protein
MQLGLGPSDPLIPKKKSRIKLHKPVFLGTCMLLPCFSSFKYILFLETPSIKYSDLKGRLPQYISDNFRVKEPNKIRTI